MSASTYAPVLTAPDFARPFQLNGDANALETGAVLMQENEDWNR